MKELAIPLPYIRDDQIAEVELSIGRSKLHYSFRIEAFPWDVEDAFTHPDDDEITRSLKRITRLKNAIQEYDPEWELIQIFNPSENSKFIQVLYRKKLKLI